MSNYDLAAKTGKFVIDNFGDGEIINRGEINVDHIAAFISPTVKNSGVINAKMATVAMGAGNTVTLDMYGDGLIELAVEGELADGLIQNTGTIEARGGNVQISAAIAKDAVDNVINMDGIVNVSSAEVKGGKIILSGGDSGRVRIPGDVRANGTEGQDAGSIEITGENIIVTNDGDIRARSIFNETGNAGDIEVIASDTLTINGEISALGLDGTGFIETSAPNTVFGPNASVLATREWLLDPTDITIDEPLSLLIEDQLALGDMTVQTPAGGTDEGDIGVRAIVDWSTDKTFKLVAADDVFLSSIGGGINATGAGNFVVEASDDFRMNAGNNSINTNSGNVTITTGDEITIDDGIINANGGNILIDNAEQFQAVADSLQTTGTGTITLNQNKDENGNTSTTDATIQNAVDAILDTGSGLNTVKVGAGTWAESTTIDKAVNLYGNNAGINGSDSARGSESLITPNSPGFLITADDVVLDGFAIDGADDGVHVDGANRVTVTNNVVMNSNDNGIKYTSSNDGFVQGNRIETAGRNGIAVLDSNNATINMANVIDNTSSAGVSLNRTTNSLVDGNNISNTGGSGVWINEADGSTVSNNVINTTWLNGSRSTGSGVYVKDTEGVTVQGNDIDNVTRDGDGVTVVDSSDTTIDDNTISNTSEHGIRITGGEGHLVTDNSIDETGADGIHASDFAIIEIAYNQITKTYDDGIEVATGFRLGDGWSGNRDGIVLINDGDGWIGDGIPLQSGNGRTLIKDNLVEGAGAFFDIESEYYGDGLGADGIHVRGVQSNFRDYYDDSFLVTAAPSGSFEGPSNEYDVQIIGNEITDVTDDGIEVIAAPFAETNLLVERNIIDNSGDNGIAIVSNSGFLMQHRFEELSVSLISPFGLLNSDVLENVVTNSENNGLFAQGGGHNDVVVSGNEFTDFDIGANFESGDIDLTGDGNTFDGGRVGMRFAPAIVGFEFPETSETAFAPLVSIGNPIFADMSLVDDTIGAQTFDRQSEFYVELDNGALFEPGTPTLLNALDSTYVGTPFGTVTPSIDFADGFTVEQLAFFEDRFFHFNDNGNTGLFFFPLLPEIDQEDIFHFFGPNAGALAGLNLTLLGLPNIPGVTPIELNNITPAAGGDGGFDPNDPSSLNAIETAAGGSEATCWGDATNAAGQGQAVNLSYGGSAEELLSGEASCGS